MEGEDPEINVADKVSRNPDIFVSWNLGSSTSFSFGARHSCSLFLTNACPTIPAESTFWAWQLRFSKAGRLRNHLLFRPGMELMPMRIP